MLVNRTELVLVTQVCSVSYHINKKNYYADSNFVFGTKNYIIGVVLTPILNLGLRSLFKCI